MSARIKRFSLIWGGFVGILCVRLGIELFTELGSYLASISEGKTEFSYLTFGIFICGTLVSLGNLITATMSSRWTDAKDQAAKASSTTTSPI